MSGQTTYQAKIIKPDGEPLEASSVNFKFTVLDPSAACVLYSETFSNVNMSSTLGLVSFSLGSGIKTYPTSGATTFENVFSNIAPSLSCDSGGPGNYTPAATDTRKIVMQFYDGTGWQTLPAMTINAVPYAMYSKEASKLSGYAASDFVHLSSVPTCAVSESLRYNGANFLCIAVGSGAGSVTSGSVVSALGYTPADNLTLLSVSSTVYSVSSTVATLATSVASLTATVSAVASSHWISSGTAIFYNLGNVGIGGSAPNSTLSIQGSLAQKTTTIATNTTLGSDDHLVFVNSASGSVTVTLPSAVGLLGREYYIQKIDSSSNLVNLIPQTGQFVGATDNKNLNRSGEYITIISDGVNWNILNEKGMSYVPSTSASTVVDVSDVSSTAYTWVPGAVASAATATFSDLGFGPLITFGGNANNNEAGYYQVNQVFSGDKEIRVSVYFNDSNSNCNDPFVIITPPGSAPVFEWNSRAGQIEYGFDCESPGIYGPTTEYFNYNISYTGGWKTLQIIYSASLSKSYLRVYDGRNNVTGLPIVDISLNEAPWGSWQMFLTADQDNPSNGNTQFADLIISDCANPETCGNPDYVPPAEIHEQIGYIPLNTAGGTMTGTLNLPSGGLNVGSGEFVVATNGNVGIGTSSPSYNLDVNGTINASSFLINGTPLQHVWNKSGSIAYYTSGNVGIATSSPQVTLDVSGSVRVGGSVATCNAAIEGSQRYNSTSKVMEYCNGTSWLKIGSQSSRKYARLATSGALTSASGTITTVSWASAVEDNGSFYSAGSPTRLTVPAGVTRVKVCASINVNSASSITMNYFQILKNNADFSGAVHVSSDAADNNWGGYGCTPAITVTTGDYFELRYYSRDVSITFSSNRTWFTVEEQ